MKRHLLVMGCSAVKLTTPGLLPAIERYDGSPYRVLRSYLRDNAWPENLSIAVLSAKYGLMGSLTPIRNYDRRMNATRAAKLRDESTSTLTDWAKDHDEVTLSLGKDYLPALHLDTVGDATKSLRFFDGGIGIKLQKLSRFLGRFDSPDRVRVEPPSGRMAYFLPDWDDMLDPRFDFANDCFSAPSKAERGDVHCCEVMRPHRMCDGILVSLAQHVLSKGPLKRFDATDATSLAPKRLRDRFGLDSDQSLFGDCGAFSYVNEDEPTLAVEQAVTLYELHGFDYGASVDHIPVTHVVQNGRRRELSRAEREKRVAITTKNARLFLEAWERRRCTFAPVGTLQALSPEAFAEQVRRYVDMGYRHLAVGGLVPLGDPEVLAVVEAVAGAANSMKRKPWIHLFGVFRPKLQSRFRELGIDSFDSATYFRKAWLRSDQNYLGSDGKWYAAVRVPMTCDPRTRNRLEAAGLNIHELAKLEERALKALHRFDAGDLSLTATVRAVAKYDQLLARSDDHGENLIADYRRTLRHRPWRKCDCSVCREIGIDALIFRGCNRNKRRGAHNTLMLYKMLKRVAASKL